MTMSNLDKLEKYGARAQFQIVDPANDMERDLVEKRNATFFYGGISGEYIVGLEPGTLAAWLIHPESVMVLAPCDGCDSPDSMSVTLEGL